MFGAYSNLLSGQVTSWINTSANVYDSSILNSSLFIEITETDYNKYSNSTYPVYIDYKNSTLVPSSPPNYSINIVNITAPNKTAYGNIVLNTNASIPITVNEFINSSIFLEPNSNYTINYLLDQSLDLTLPEVLGNYDSDLFYTVNGTVLSGIPYIVEEPIIVKSYNLNGSIITPHIEFAKLHFQGAVKAFAGNLSNYLGILGEVSEITQVPLVFIIQCINANDVDDLVTILEILVNNSTGSQVEMTNQLVTLSKMYGIEK